MLGFSDVVMSKLRIRYVSHVPQCAEELSPDVVEPWIRISGTKLDVNIVRRGFMLADPVMLKIRERVRRLAADTRGIKRPLAERIGFSPELSSEWRRFRQFGCERQAMLTPSFPQRVLRPNNNQRSSVNDFC